MITQRDNYQANIAEIRDATFRACLALIKSAKDLPEARRMVLHLQQAMSEYDKRVQTVEAEPPQLGRGMNLSGGGSPNGD